ncbi:hypothetical protein MMC25_001532 [Agyrium rufum]|nr:hypothetical protein [Agyrium rufum]
MANLASSTFDQSVTALQYIEAQVPEALQKPRVGIICGSGLGGLANLCEEPLKAITYADIPHFPQSTVQGHAGELLFGTLGKQKSPVVLMVGRVQSVTTNASDVTLPVRVMRLLGVETLIVTNAAGGLNDTYKVGDIVILNDHLNIAGFAGNHPLRGPNDDRLGVRFPPLSDAYDLALRRRAHQTWQKLEKYQRRRMHEGVYAFVSGPSYETRAECRMLRMLGADLVGMSTVPEIIVARHSGMRVLALSLVTNNVVIEPGPKGDDPKVQDVSEGELADINESGKANHQEVLEAGRQAASDMQDLVLAMIEDMNLVAP